MDKTLVPSLLFTRSHVDERLDDVATVQWYLIDVESALRSAVQRAREAGVSWELIGDQFGVSRQAAWERFHIS